MNILNDFRNSITLSKILNTNKYKIDIIEKWILQFKEKLER